MPLKLQSYSNHTFKVVDIPLYPSIVYHRVVRKKSNLLSLQGNLLIEPDNQTSDRILFMLI